MKTVQLPFYRQLKFETPISIAIPTPDNGYLLWFHKPGELVKIDAAFNIAWRKPLPCNDSVDYNYRHLSVADNGKRIGFTDLDSVRILDEHGDLLYTHMHLPWFVNGHVHGTTCLFRNSDTIWFVAPNPEGGENLLHVLDQNDCSAIVSQKIQETYSLYLLSATPDKNLNLLRVFDHGDALITTTHQKGPPDAYQVAPSHSYDFPHFMKELAKKSAKRAHL